MPQFQPDQVTFGDMPGYGAWDLGHGREHIQFVQKLSAQSPPVLLSDFDLLSLLTSGQSRRSQVDSHQQAHALLNGFLGLTSIDFSQVNLDDQNDFLNWMGYHSQTHAQIRAALGLT